MHTQYNEPPTEKQSATDQGSADSRPKWERLLARLPQYAKSSELREAWIELLGQFHWDLFGTLTFRNDTHPEAAHKLFRMFISQLNRKLYGPRWHKHGKGIVWCVAMERQLRGVLHLHCLLADPEIERLLKGSWFRQGGHWANHLNEMWNELAGFARIEPIKALELVQRYVSKYVIKGGEIDLGGPMMQRRLEQAPAGSDANLGQRGPCGLVIGSVSVPVPSRNEVQRVVRVGEQLTIAATFLPLEAWGARRSGLIEAAQEHGAHEGEAIIPRTCSGS